MAMQMMCQEIMRSLIVTYRYNLSVTLRMVVALSVCRNERMRGCLPKIG